MHIMLDLETMGTKTNAPIIAIGAVTFDANGIGNKSFYKTVDLQSAVDTGAITDPATIIWWMRQSDDARTCLTREAEMTLIDALRAFEEWMGDTQSLLGMWGNGAAFDNVIYRESYQRCHMGRDPWPFWKDRCYRTVKGLFPNVPMERSGTHHNALDDAISQAKHLIEISKAHGNFL